MGQLALPALGLSLTLLSFLLLKLTIALLLLEIILYCPLFFTSLAPDPECQASDSGSYGHALQQGA